MKNLKQQFIEKSLNKILTSKYVIALALELPTEVYDDFIKKIAKVIHFQLSECWDMAGEDFAKRFITLMRRKYDLHEHMHYSEIEDNLNSLTSQKEGKENLISLKDMIDEK